MAEEKILIADDDPAVRRLLIPSFWAERSKP